SGAQAQKRFCDQILQLRTLAPQDFRSIDRGHENGAEAGIHVSSVQLSNDGCEINRFSNGTSGYSCGWMFPVASVEARFRETGRRIADCLQLRPDWMTHEDGTSELNLESGHVRYHLEIDAYDIGDEGGFTLMVSVLKP
ncbi:MAG: hypothetical protein ACRETL_00045, partial [Gammaproteobacteria bacterium]